MNEQCGECQKQRKRKLKYKRREKLASAELAAAQAQMQALSLTVNKLRSGLTCSICCDFLVLPFTIQCGHSFCYECLIQWCRSIHDPTRDDDSDGEDNHIIRTPTCPMCRCKLTRRPAKSQLLPQQVEHLLADDDEQLAEYYRRRRLSTALYDRDSTRESADPWLRLFPGQVLQDTLDGVKRCQICLWEIVDNRCMNCGVQYDDTLHSSDDDNSDQGDDCESETNLSGDRFDSDGNDLDKYDSTDIDDEDHDSTDIDDNDHETFVSDDDVLVARNGKSRRKLSRGNNENGRRKLAERETIFVDSAAEDDRSADDIEETEGQQFPREVTPTHSSKRSRIVVSDSSEDDGDDNDDEKTQDSSSFIADMQSIEDGDESAEKLSPISQEGDAEVTTSESSSASGRTDILMNML